MIKADYDSLYQLGELARNIKGKIYAKNFKTDVEIKQYLQKTCDRYQLQFPFPPLIASDQVISHVAIDTKNPTDLEKPLLYTIDFGFKDKKTKMIIDNSVTVVNHEEFKPLVALYDKKIQAIEKSLAEILKKYGFLTVEAITYHLDLNFSTQNENLHVVPFACSHTILRDQLHGVTIPHELDSDLLAMKKQGTGYLLKREHHRLMEDTVFTIEPHVLILSDAHKTRISSQDSKVQTPLSKKIAYDHLKANVVYLKKKKQYVALQDALAQNITDYTEIQGLWANYPSFFNENTYLIKDRKLLKVT